jgi:hypothetical protein
MLEWGTYAAERVADGLLVSHAVGGVRASDLIQNVSTVFWRVDAFVLSEKLRAFLTNLDEATALLLAEDLAGVIDNLAKVLEALLDVFNIQALLTSPERALAVHGTNVLRDSRDDVLEVVDHLLRND